MADVTFGDAGLMNSSGWSRSLRAEGITSRVSRDGVDQDEHGLRMSGMIDTPNHGAITLDASLRSSDGYSYGSESGYTVSLYQIGMPMNGRWLVNNAIGVSSSPAVDLARNQQRFWVPSSLQDGMAIEWRKADALQLQASYGSPDFWRAFMHRLSRTSAASRFRRRAVDWQRFLVRGGTSRRRRRREPRARPAQLGPDTLRILGVRRSGLGGARPACTTEPGAEFS